MVLAEVLVLEGQEALVVVRRRDALEMGLALDLRHRPLPLGEDRVGRELRRAILLGRIQRVCQSLLHLLRPSELALRGFARCHLTVEGLRRFSLGRQWQVKCTGCNTGPLHHSDVSYFNDTDASDEDLAAGALATHLEAVLQAAQRFCALVDAFVADAVAGDSRAATLAARLDDSTAHFRAAARRFTRLLKRASEDEPEATKLAFRLEVVGQAVE